jgi:hypothetical protein
VAARTLAFLVLRRQVNSPVIALTVKNRAGIAVAHRRVAQTTLPSWSCVGSAPQAAAARCTS